MRRVLALTLVLAPACVDDEALENTECVGDADCAPSQSCVITPYQAQNKVPLGTSELVAVGWCRPEDEGCAVGEQPGCFCDVQNGQNICGSSAPEQLIENDICFCVFAGDGTTTG